MNPLLVGVTNPQTQPLKQMFQQVQKMQNPQMYLQQILSQNPKAKEIMSVIQSNNGNLKDAYFELAKRTGQDPNIILNQLR